MNVLYKKEKEIQKDWHKATKPSMSGVYNPARVY
jgi:hypothetical protein